MIQKEEQTYDHQHLVPWMGSQKLSLRTHRLPAGTDPLHRPTGPRAELDLPGAPAEVLGAVDERSVTAIEQTLFKKKSPES
jgi:hypothetical protein